MGAGGRDARSAGALLPVRPGDRRYCCPRRAAGRGGAGACAVGCALTRWTNAPAGDLFGSVDRSVDLSQERFHTEYFDPLELRVQCATVLSTLVLLPVFFYAAVAMNPEVPIGAMRQRAAISMAAGTLTAHACFVLFGAPVITAFFKTFALSVCIGAVVVLPLGCSLGGDVKAWQRVISHNDPRRPAEAQFYVPSALTAFGAWLGAFPIPLDWDRPWQVWMRDKVLSQFLELYAVKS